MSASDAPPSRPPPRPPPPVPPPQVLAWLTPADRAVLAQVALPFLAAVDALDEEYDYDEDFGSPCAGKSAGVPLRVRDFVGSSKRLAWAKWNGCPWTEATCAIIAGGWGGQVEVLRYARQHYCPWDATTCEAAALVGRCSLNCAC